MSARKIGVLRDWDKDTKTGIMEADSSSEDGEYRINEDNILVRKQALVLPESLPTTPIPSPLLHSGLPIIADAFLGSRQNLPEGNIDKFDRGVLVWYFLRDGKPTEVFCPKE